MKQKTENKVKKKMNDMDENMIDSIIGSMFSNVINTVSKMMDGIKERLNEIYRKCLDRKMDQEQAVDAIDKVIGGITAVYFKQGKKFTIQNHAAIYSLKYNGGLPKREEKEAERLAYMAYRRAQANGNPMSGEVHIGAYASTKHHTQGLAALI